MVIADELNRSLREGSEPVTKEEKRHRKEKEKQVRLLKEHAGKLDEYNEKAAHPWRPQLLFEDRS